jgi:sulfide:quinone oxidoreductase
VRAVMAVPPWSLTARSVSSPWGPIFRLRRAEYVGGSKMLRRSDDTPIAGEHNGSMPEINVPAGDPAAASADGGDVPSGPPVRVLIAGGGIAALEALTALRALAGPRVKPTLVAPGHEFVYRPVAIDEPYAVGRSRRIQLDRAASEAGAGFLIGMVESVDTDAKRMRTSEDESLDYDALVLAMGAQTVPSVAGALTWDDRADSDILGGLMQDLEQGYASRVVVVIPPGPVWPLRGYELALFITLEAQGMSVDMETTIVTPEDSPLALLTPSARELITTELERAGIAVVPAARVRVEPGHPHTVVLEPSGRVFEADRVVALPALRGQPIAGIPAQADGFIEVDEHCRVRGVDGVWAVGDSTAFPLKAGGFAAEQADVAAEDIAAIAGAAVEPHAFDPADRDELAGLPAGRFFESWLAESDDPTLTTHLPVGTLPPLTFLHRDLEASWRGEI